MRVSLLLLPALFLAGASPCRAQLGDKTLSERLRAVMTEDLDKNAPANPLGAKSYEGGGSFKLRPANEQKAFAGEKDFQAKSYTTRSFLGIKNPWFGDKVYDTAKADVWTKNALDAQEKKFAVEEAKTKSFFQGGKEAALSANPVETRAYTEKGKAQGALDEQKKNLTVDDVREILNKNR